MVPDGWKNKKLLSIDLEKMMKSGPEPEQIEVTVNKIEKIKTYDMGSENPRISTGTEEQYIQTEIPKRNIIPTIAEVFSYYYCKPTGFFDKHFGAYAKFKKNFEATYARELCRGEYIHAKLVWPEKNLEVNLYNINPNNIRCTASTLEHDSSW